MCLFVIIGCVLLLFLFLFCCCCCIVFVIVVAFFWGWGGGWGGVRRLGKRVGSEGLRDCVFVCVRVCACVDAGEG